MRADRVNDDDIPGMRYAIERTATKLSIYLFLGLALLGGVLFIVGLVQLWAIDPKALDAVPQPVLLIVIGMVDFALFLPWFTALYFARHFLVTAKRLEREIEVLRNQVAALSDRVG